MMGELWSDMRYRLRALVRRADVERELDDELRFHVEREAEKYVRVGVPPDDAMRRARLRFGGVEYTKEQSRDARGTVWLEALIQDLRYATRSLRQHRAFSLTVILTLALGIGANTAIFALIDALLLRTLPVPHADQLVTIGDPAAVTARWTGSPTTDFVSYPLYVDVRDHNDVLSGLYANGSAGDVDVTIGADAAVAPEHPVTRLVSGNFFSVLELPAHAGRTFTPDDDRPSEPTPVAVISDAYWQRRFAGARAAIGSVIHVNGAPITIVGVAPPRFAGDIVGQPTDMWLPISMQPALQPRRNMVNDRETSWLVLMGRLAPGATLQQARAILPVIEADAARAHVTGVHRARFDEDLKASPIRIEAGGRGFSLHREVYGPALIILMAAVALVILVVCANVSNLMLARAMTRMREMTVRMSLGAGRGRLLQQLLTESALLALVAGALGLLAAVWGSHLLLAVVRGDPPVLLDVTPNALVLTFTAGTTLGCVLLFGLVPAFRVTRVDLATALRAHGRNLTGAATRVSRVPLAKALVVAQIALSTVLLIGSALLVRSMKQLLRADLGMDRDHVVAVHVATSRTNYLGARLLAFQRELMERVRAVPGVDAASYSKGGPFSGGHSSGHVSVQGFVARADSEGEVYYDNVGPDYFHAIGARVLRGRDFTSGDIDAGARVAAIDATMAKFYLRGLDPIGRSVTLDSETFTIVAVVRDVQYSDVRADPVRRLYLPDVDATERPKSFELQVHVRGAPGRFIEPVRQALLAADRTVPIDVTPLAERVRGSVSQDALLTQVTAFFGAIALILAALGLYGVTAYATTQRTGEFGLRAALGAEPWRVARMVLRDAVIVAMSGVTVGVPIGLLATRLLRGALFGVSPLDLPSLSVAVGTLVLTALVASYLPAWRAAKVSPLQALRMDN
jgi:predicted permease